MILLAGRFEAGRLCRHPLVLASALIFAALIWRGSQNAVPQWWVWDVQICSTLLEVAAAVLIAAQLAAGRSRRDGSDALYASYPTPPAARLAAQLAGLAGPLALAVTLIAGAVTRIDLLGPAGSPRPGVLVQGVLLIALGGAVGIALGSWRPHPLAGVIAVIVIGAMELPLLRSWSETSLQPARISWLFPWNQPDVGHALPGPVPVIPPAAHLPWLAALTALAAVVGAARFARSWSSRSTAVVATVAAASLAAGSWSGWAQTRPVSPAIRAQLNAAATRPARAQVCLSEQRVRYCFYPAYRPEVARWSAVINGLLSQLPGPRAAGLVVRQVMDLDPWSPPYYVGYQAAPASAISSSDGIYRFISAEQSDPRLIPGSSVPPVYVSLSWATGPALGSYQLGLALQAARWVAGLPNTSRSVSYNAGHNTSLCGSGPGDCVPQVQVTCLPVGQAREAIAVWLAGSATPETRPELLAALGYPWPARAARSWITTYNTFSTAGYGFEGGINQGGPATVTGTGLRLGAAMLALPAGRVRTVLAARWPGWLNPRATDSQLAAALGIALPAVPMPQRSLESPAAPSDPICR